MIERAAAYSPLVIIIAETEYMRQPDWDYTFEVLKKVSNEKKKFYFVK
jgi:hypothetical protein